MIILRHGDCVDVLGTCAEGTVGAIVCDPPYGLEFMGKEWDKLDGTVLHDPSVVGGFQDGGGGNPFSRSRIRYGRDWQGGGGSGIGERATYSATSRHGMANPTCGTCGGRLRGAKKCVCDKPIGKRRNPENEGLPDDMTGSGMSTQLNRMQEWHRGWLSEAFRVLRPGGVIKAFSGTRTYHRLAMAMADVGFVDIGLEAWAYGSGFPKSMNISLSMDKAARGTPQGSTKGDPKKRGRGELPSRDVFAMGGSNGGAPTGLTDDYGEYAPETDAAKKWEGWGTALKPAWEPVLVGRKP